MRRSPPSPPIPPDSAVASQSHLHTRDSFLFSTKTPQNAAPTTAWSNPSSPRGSWQVLGVAPTIPVQLILCRFPIRESIPRCGKFSSSFFRREKAAHFFFTMGKSPTDQIEHQETIAKKDVDTEQDALYQAYASKGPEWHQKMTRTLLRKVDLHLLPFLILMYLLNFLDRK